METDEQKKLTRICIRCAALLLQYNAGGELIETSIVRLAKAIGLNSIEITTASNSVVITSLFKGDFLTLTKQVMPTYSNMAIISEIERLLNQIENGNYQIKEIDTKLKQMRALRYPKIVLVPLVSVACACFNTLNGDANLQAFLVTLLACSVACFIFFTLISNKINIFFNYAITAFAAISTTGLLTQLPYLNESNDTAFVASILLLVPVVFIFNMVSDLCSGHISSANIQISKIIALTTATCIGIALAIYIWDLPTWI